MGAWDCDVCGQWHMRERNYLECATGAAYRARTHAARWKALAKRLYQDRRSLRIMIREDVRLCSELAMELQCPDSWKDGIDAIRTLRAERDRLREALEASLGEWRRVLEEVEKTMAWRRTTGMRPATDTSEFCSLPPSALKALERRARRALQGED